jgi:uncharacterized Zn-binding protein involved in type VI secretion
MPPVHRHGDLRTCGATTVVTGQSTVHSEGKLWAVEGDLNTHGGGALIASQTAVKIEGKSVIVHQPDNAQPDDLCPIANAEHCAPKTAQGSDKTFLGG